MANQPHRVTSTISHWLKKNSKIRCPMDLRGGEILSPLIHAGKFPDLCYIVFVRTMPRGIRER
jgi:hypothetical protein